MKQQFRINESDASMTIHEVSELAGISVRTLQYYDKIGLLKPSARTDAGYRLYGRSDLARLQQILLFRELEFPLKEIRAMIESPRYDQERALDQQIELLQLKREHLENLIAFAKDLKANAGAASAQQTMQRASRVATKEKSRGSVVDDSRGAATAAAQNGTPINTRSKTKGEVTMSFEAFDTSKLDEYKAQAKASWGDSAEWKEYEEKSEGRTSADELSLGERLMSLFVLFGEMAAAGADPASDAAKQQAASIQEFISENFYRCTNEVFAQLGVAYGAGGDFTRNINAVAGEGAAEFAAKAIENYCAQDGE